eukprot:7391422-Prymnesium_polylepis.2
MENESEHVPGLRRAVRRAAVPRAGVAHDRVTRPAKLQRARHPANARVHLRVAVLVLPFVALDASQSFGLGDEIGVGESMRLGPELKRALRLTGDVLERHIDEEWPRGSVGIIKVRVLEERSWHRSIEVHHNRSQL